MPKLTLIPVRRLAACSFITIIFAACSESSVVPPTAPSLLSTERVGELGIACTANIQVQSIDGKAVPVSFSLATTEGGEAPVTTTCDAESNAEFPIARTTVDCSASDNLGQAASCSFDVVVLSPPKLSVSKILAFGDSITSGIVSIPILGVIQLGLEPWNSYPTKLQGKLRQAYQYQAPSVINEGVAGERAADAPARLRAALNRHQPDVVILMEGTNDLGAADAEESARDQLALDGIEEMLDEPIEVEREFAEDVLSGGVAGMSATDTRTYLEFVADQRLAQLGLPKRYGSKNPFDFMELQDVQELTNFFERTVAAYQHGVEGDVAFDEDF